MVGSINLCLSHVDICCLIVDNLDVGDRLAVMVVAQVWRQVVNMRWNSSPITYLNYKSRSVDSGALKTRIVRTHHNETSYRARILIIGNAFDVRPKDNLCLDIMADEVNSLSTRSSFTYALPTRVSYPLGGAFASTVDKEGDLLLFGGWVDAVDDLSWESYRGRTSQRLQLEEYTNSALWTSLPSISFQRCFAAATSSLLGDIFLLGGSDSPFRGATVYSDAIVFRSSDESFETPLSCPSMLERRAGHSAVTLFDDSVVVLGGYAGGADYLCTVEQLDPAAQRWLPLPDMAVPRSGFACIVGEGGAIYVAGGSPDGSFGHKSLERLDLRVGRWEALPSMHYRRGYTAGCIGNRGCLYISGGISGNTRQSSLEIFDPRRNSWESVACVNGNENLARAAHVMHFVMR